MPTSLDTFGWCTWDAFYFTVSAQGVGQGLNSLVAGGAPPQWLVIDDGWQVKLHVAMLCEDLACDLGGQSDPAVAEPGLGPCECWSDVVQGSRLRWCSL